MKTSRRNVVRRHTTQRVAGRVVLPVLVAAVFSACDDAHIQTPPPPGSTCPRLEDFMHVVAIGRSDGRVFDATVLSSFAFTAGGSDAVSIFDFSDRSNVRMLASLDALNDARAVDAAGTWLFVADGKNGLAVVDVSKPAAAGVAKTVTMPGAAVDVRVEGDHAYVANDVLGLVIVDVSAPASASITGIENTPGAPVGVAASGPLAFLADVELGLRVVDIADDTSPFLIRTVDMPGYVEAVDAEENLVAVAVGTTGVAFVDASSVSEAAVVGTIDTPINAIGVALAGSTAFIADGSTGVIMADVRDASHPTLRGVIGTSLYAQGVSVAGGRLLIAEEQAGVRVVDITPATTAPFDSLLAGGDVWSLSPLGSLVAVTDLYFGLRVVDPAAGAVVGELAISGASTDVLVADSLAYVARGGAGVLVVDLHDPTAPVAAGEIFGGILVDALGVGGEFIYMLDRSGWLVEQRLDGTGSQRVFHDSGVLWRSLTVDRHALLGNILYVPNRQGGVLVIPALQFTPITQLPVAGSPERVLIRHADGPLGPGTRAVAYVAASGIGTGQSHIEIYDVTDFQAPVFVERFDCGGNAMDVTLTETHMVVGEGSDGCEVFDLVGGGRARPSGWSIGPALRVAVSNGTLVAAGGKSGVLLVPLDDCLK